MWKLIILSSNKGGYYLINCHLKYCTEARQLAPIDAVKNTSGSHDPWAALWSEGSGVKCVCVCVCVCNFFNALYVLRDS